MNPPPQPPSGRPTHMPLSAMPGRPLPPPPFPPSSSTQSFRPPVLPPPSGPLPPSQQQNATIPPPQGGPRPMFPRPFVPHPSHMSTPRDAGAPLSRPPLMRPGYPPMRPGYPPHHRPMMMRKVKRIRKPTAEPPKEPNETLYIRNLHENRSPKVLVRDLTRLFSQYSKVLQVIARKGIKGQAFVVFPDIKSAIRAKKGAEGAELYDRPLDIQFARMKSFLIAEKEGQLDEVKQKREEKLQMKLEEERRQKEELERQEQERQQRILFIQQQQQLAIKLQEQHIPPNAILFVQNLSENISKEMLEVLFARYPGFKEVRVVPGKKDIAFVEYEDEHSSTVAKNALDKHKWDDSTEMSVNYAKR